MDSPLAIKTKHCLYQAHSLPSGTWLFTWPQGHAAIHLQGTPADTQGVGLAGEPNHSAAVPAVPSIFNFHP